MNNYVSWGHVSRDTSLIIGPYDGKSISRNIVSLNVPVHDMINLSSTEQRSWNIVTHNNISSKKILSFLKLNEKVKIKWWA